MSQFGALSDKNSSVFAKEHFPVLKTSHSIKMLILPSNVDSISPMTMQSRTEWGGSKAEK